MDLVNFLRSSNIPYVHVDVTIRPFVRAFIKFIQYTDTHDVAMIFQNEKGEKSDLLGSVMNIFYWKNYVCYGLRLVFTEQYEGIYEILSQYSIRSITFDGLNKTTANRIANLRPMPSHFAILARPTEMLDLFESVITVCQFSIVDVDLTLILSNNIWVNKLCGLSYTE